jgi:hypothetical protein
MNRRNAIPLIAVLIIRIGTAQDPQQPTQSQAVANELEQAFQAAVRSDLPESSLTNASVFALNHPEIAIPILLGTIKRRLNEEPEADPFIRRASELIAYIAKSDSIDAISELCDLDNARFATLVSRTLDYAINRHREYELAFYAVQTHPSLSKMVGLWLKEQFEFPLSDKRLARAIVKREEAGISPDMNESLLRLLDTGAQESLRKALEQVRSPQQ